ncbi:MAG: ribonuclease III [Cyanobacteria bacterium J06638_22]
MPSLPPHREKALRQLIQKLGLPDNSPINWLLLDQALIHPSADAEHNYERLEFYGDAVLKLAASRFLYEHFPKASEGEMSVLRDVLVSDRTLAHIGDRYNLERYLLVGKSLQHDQTGRMDRIAEATEAMIAVLYLSGSHSLQLVKPWLEPHLQTATQTTQQDPAQHNYKGALQELTQKHVQTLPDYRVFEVGSSSGREKATTKILSDRFVAEVWLQGKQWGQGSGQSKKAAEQVAAKAAFLALRETMEEKS